MLHTFCRTMGELTENLRKTPKDGRPIFAMTRPLELHIGNIATATVPAGESYPGFYGPYAARVKRIDACFGEFIGALKELHLYDNSIVVLTADHGDSLGEGQRWGHGFTVFPEVMRIPLIIHVPPALRTRVTADLARVSFSIDITPTLYALAGEMPSPPRERDQLKGEPLLVPPSVDLARRRRGEYLVASSYGAVYGLLSHNGRRLYIADGIEGREYAFDLSPGAGDRRIGVTDAERDAARLTIRRQIGDLADWYHFTPAP
jgi:membrane-anchored protein YejM (alkaline phosphatase superfamily)